VSFISRWLGLCESLTVSGPKTVKAMSRKRRMESEKQLSDVEMREGLVVGLKKKRLLGRREIKNERLREKLRIIGVRQKRLKQIEREAESDRKRRETVDIL